MSSPLHGSAAAGVPRLAMINSMAGFGRCSTTIALPVISAMQVQVCPIPTSVLSNHLAFPACARTDYTPYMQDYINVWKELNVTFDGLYCGFLGNVEQMAIVEDFLKHFKPEIFLLDPVMGDNGNAYSSITPEHSSYLKHLLSYADILTPNVTEACLLTDTPFRDKGWTDRELQALCEKLSVLCSGRIIITGVPREDYLVNAIWANGLFTPCPTQIAGQARHGTGDLFASILIADALRGVDLTASVKKASDFIGLCIRESDKMGLPLKEGIPFEKYLYDLINYDRR